MIDLENKNGNQAFLKNPWQELTILIFVFFVSGSLLWWGTKIHPIIAGWITVPMLYQLGIWATGTALVFIICFKVWADDEPKQEGN